MEQWRRSFSQAAGPKPVDRRVNVDKHGAENAVRNDAQPVAMVHEPWREGVEAVEIDIVKRKPVEPAKEDSQRRTYPGQH